MGNVLKALVVVGTLGIGMAFGAYVYTSSVQTETIEGTVQAVENEYHEGSTTWVTAHVVVFEDGRKIRFIRLIPEPLVKGQKYRFVYENFGKRLKLQSMTAIE